MPTQHSLKFNTQPYHDNEVENAMLHFREFGFATLPNVFERESVDAFDAEVRAALIRSSSGTASLPEDSSLKVWPTRAPRMRQVLDRALSGDLMRPRSSMFEVAWLISPSKPTQAGPDENWHKDRGHRGNDLPGYQYPKDIHVGMYFADMTLDMGPTQIVAGSHMDQTRSPYNSPDKVKSFLIQKQDMMLWDQRCWHRGTNRIIAGERVFALFGFYSVPIYHEGQHRMSPAQRAALLEATDPAERTLYGGVFVREGLNVKDPGALG
jgi:hypothetical protein